MVLLEHTAALQGNRLRIENVVAETANIISIELRRADGADLDPWQPGAHLDVRLPSGRVRQYSLCGDPQERSRYRIAVRRDEHGRGGSMELHALACPGGDLEIRGLRNHFPFGDGARYLFLAGGIGITPILPMILTAERQGRPWVLIYVGRSAAAMAFTGAVAARQGGRARLVPSDVKGRVDFEPIIESLAPEVAVYACGPINMLDAIQRAAVGSGRTEQVRVERFAAPPSGATAGPRSAFEVELRRSGVRLHVPSERTLADVLKDAGAPVSFSCEEGCCGLCESRVIAGTPEHNDCILTGAERAAGDRMMVCVGRSHSPVLILDL